MSLYVDCDYVCEVDTLEEAKEIVDSMCNAYYDTHTHTRVISNDIRDSAYVECVNGDVWYYEDL